MARLTFRSHERQRGDGLVEFALVLPVLLLLLFGILDGGRAVYAYHVVANSAREGARYASVTTRTASEVRTKVLAYAVALDPAQVSVELRYPTATTVQVEVRYNFSLFTPVVAQAMGGNTLVLHSAATMYNGY
jgi:Flp pilus assembly protein TadG